MNLRETASLLALISNLDNRRVDDATVVIWQELFADFPYADCVVAVREHFRASTDYLMPAHIISGARALARERIRAVNQQREIESRHPTDPTPLHDRSSALRAFVAAVRGALPEGDPDTLRWGHKQWRLASQRRAEQEKAQQGPANPHYRPEAVTELAAMVAAMDASSTAGGH